MLEMDVLLMVYKGGQLMVLYYLVLMECGKKGGECKQDVYCC